MIQSSAPNPEKEPAWHRVHIPAPVDVAEYNSTFVKAAVLYLSAEDLTLMPLLNIQGNYLYSAEFINKITNVPFSSETRICASRQPVESTTNRWMGIENKIVSFEFFSTDLRAIDYIRLEVRKQLMMIRISSFYFSVLSSQLGQYLIDTSMMAIISVVRR